MKHSTTRKASSVTPIWKPLGCGSSLLGPHLTPGCPLATLNRPKVPTEITQRSYDSLAP